MRPSINPNDEPMRFIAAAIAILNAVMIAVGTFGVDLTAEQSIAIMGVANSIGGFIALAWARPRVVAAKGMSLELWNDPETKTTMPVAHFANGTRLVEIDPEVSDVTQYDAEALDL